MSEKDDLISNIIERSLTNASQSLYDDYVKTNASFRSNAGLKAKIVRTLHGKGCKWCRNLAGSYSYPDVPRDVYRRHDNCSCIVTYVTEKGTQDVWSKKLKEDTVVLENRKKIGLSSNDTVYLIQSGGKYKTGSKEWFQSYEKKASKAYEYYQKALSIEDDITNISKSSGMSIEEVKEIKNHIFFDTHILYGGESDKFQPDYDMAVAWKRLNDGNPEQRDLVLLKHELLESKIEKNYSIDASKAHRIANKTYNWETELLNELGEDGEDDDLL